PSVLMGLSYGGFGGGFGSNISNFNNRMDADAIAYWELRNLGRGDQAARGESRSRLEQARYREIMTLDRVAREVVEAQTQVQARRKQIEIAREAIQSALNSHSRNLQRIENGKGLPIEVLQSIQALTQARREYLRAVIDYNRAQFGLHWALGAPIA
ncbi:MAG TPA: TolC family protein, partial [Planctomycetaceae bacterium]|nr:TolC family protein [Planctomycetaceae bacterium]